MAHNMPSSNGSIDTSNTAMVPWLHFQMGDALYFQAWVPATPGAVFGACFGLFLLAIIERLVSAMRGVMEQWWSVRANEILARRFATLQETTIDGDQCCDKPPESTASLPSTTPRRRANPPFIPSHDLARGAIYAGQSAIGYALMLAVMTFHAGYIISIIVGLGVGEVLFGRFSRGVHLH